MKKSFQVFFLIIIMGFYSSEFVYSAEPNQDYLQLKIIYNEQRWELEEDFEDKFRESKKIFDDQKQEILLKNETDPSLTTEQINQMLQTAFSEYTERQEDIRAEYDDRVDALNMMFKVKFEKLGSEMPLWVEFVMELWQNGNLSDSEFVNFLSFVINNNIIQLEHWIFSKYFI